MATTKIHRTFGTPTNLDKWTYSAWIKLGPVSTLGYLFECTTGASNFTAIKVDSTARLFFGNYNSGYLGQRDLTRLLRDPSAWYHIVAVWDSDNATPADRMKLYINGVQQTTYHGTTNPTSGEACQMASGADCWIGVHQSTNDYFSGEMSWVQFVDGSALAPTEFGEVDATSGIWKIKTTPYATPGNNGFCLKMEDRTNLDLDSSSNAHTFTTTGTLTATYDNPSNNFCTMNPLDNFYAGDTFSNGNTTATTSTAYGYSRCTQALLTGKWYWEIKATTIAATDYTIGIASKQSLSATDWVGSTSESYSYVATDGKIYTSAAGTAYGDTYSAGDIIGVYLDLDNNKLYFAKNGTVQNSGTGYSITASASTTDGVYASAIGAWSGTGGNVFDGNFGNGYFGTTAVTSAVADEGGIGAFEYDPSAGTFDGSSKDFRAICTNNIATYGG